MKNTKKNSRSEVWGMKPLALDLCCGKGGWTIGLLKAGWDVIGVDIEKWEGYPGIFRKMDVREVTAEQFEEKVSLVVASPPCQDFSYSSLPFKKAKAKFSKENPPDPSIWRACERIANELNAPLILENVRGAQKWMGKASWHYGSFYFWGEMPALIPIGCPRKGFWRVDTEYEKRTGKHGMRGDRPKNFMPGEYERKSPININGPKMSATKDRYKRLKNGSKLGGLGACQVGPHGSNARKEWSAKVAMIPPELSEWIGVCFKPK